MQQILSESAGNQTNSVLNVLLAMGGNSQAGEVSAFGELGLDALL